MSDRDRQPPVPESNSAGPSSHFQLPATPEQRGAAPSVPDEVVGARQAWLWTAAMQALLAVVTGMFYWLDPNSVKQMVDAVSADPAVQNLDEPTMALAIRIAVVMFVAFMLVICVVFALFTKSMYKGSYWARFILMAGSGYLVLEALLLFFTSGASPMVAAPMWMQLLHAALVIGSAAAAAAGIVLSSTKKATEYFIEKNPKIFDKRK